LVVAGAETAAHIKAVVVEEEECFIRENYSLTPQKYAVTVGVGGTWQPYYGSGPSDLQGGPGAAPGDNSSFGAVTALGGGGGGNFRCGLY